MNESQCNNTINVSQAKESKRNLEFCEQVFNLVLKTGTVFDIRISNGRLLQRCGAAMEIARSQ